MRRFSLRRSLLALIARVLERWLGVVTARLEPGEARQPADPRQPPPPDHWVELVRQHAPQLLDSESPDVADSSLIIDWQANPAAFETPARALRLHPSQHRHTPPVAARTTPPAAKNRPLRLERVAVERLDADDVTAHPADSGTAPPTPDFARTTERPVATTVPIHFTDAPEQDVAPTEPHFGAHLAEPGTPPEVRTSVPAVTPVRQRRLFGLRLPSVNLLMRRRRSDAPALQVAPRGGADLRPEEPPPRAVPTTPTPAERLSPYFSGESFERQHIRETRSSIPSAVAPPRLADVRTGAGGGVHPHQQRTGIPGAPPQLVLRPTHVFPPLNVEDITSDRWASLPDTPADEPRDPTNARYERLKREQEGRAWSE